MPRPHRLGVLSTCLLSAGALAVAAAPVSAADTVVAGNHIVTGKQCVGPLCADGEAFASGLPLVLKSGDTPGARLLQTNDSGFTAQTWDIAGNEANFFVRDLTGGSRLPFRIRPGAPTSSLDILANSDVATVGIVKQQFNTTTVLEPVDPTNVLAALRGLTLNRYRVNADSANTPHIAPEPAAFRAAFGVGGSDTDLAPADVAGVALAAVQALDARVSTLSLTPGPKGDAGAAGPKGDTGATGASGAPGAPASTADLAAATQRIAALERANRKLSRDLASLRKAVRKLTPKKTTTAKKKTAASRSARR